MCAGWPRVVGTQDRCRVLMPPALADVDFLLGPESGAEPRPGWGICATVRVRFRLLGVAEGTSPTEIWIGSGCPTAMPPRSAVQLRPWDGGAGGVIVRYSTPTPLASPPTGRAQPRCQADTVSPWRVGRCTRPQLRVHTAVGGDEGYSISPRGDRNPVPVGLMNWRRSPSRRSPAVAGGGAAQRGDRLPGDGLSRPSQ